MVRINSDNLYIQQKEKDTDVLSSQLSFPGVIFCFNLDYSNKNYIKVQGKIKLKNFHKIE